MNNFMYVWYRYQELSSQQAYVDNHFILMLYLCSLKIYVLYILYAYSIKMKKIQFNNWWPWQLLIVGI